MLLNLGFEKLSLSREDAPSRSEVFDFLFFCSRCCIIKNYTEVEPLTLYVHLVTLLFLHQQVYMHKLQNLPMHDGEFRESE